MRAICVISLTTLIDRGLDVPGILQDLIRKAQAGNGLDSKKWGQNRNITRETKKGLQLERPQALTGIGAGGETRTLKAARAGGF